MSAKIKTLFDKVGNKLYPKTKTSAVYDDNNNTLDSVIANKLDKYASGSSDWDSAPTQNSTKAITSGGVYQAISDAIGQALTTQY